MLYVILCSLIPTYHKLYQFLEQHRSALGNASPAKPQIKKFGSQKPVTVQSRFTTSLLAKSDSLKCRISNLHHLIYRCQEFLAKARRERYSIAKLKRLCLNCLGNRHLSNACQSSHSCRQCVRGIILCYILTRNSRAILRNLNQRKLTP